MAKHNCAICGAEVSLLSEQKLADGNYICRKVCSKKTFKIFDKVAATLGDVTAHIEQIEKGPRSWNEVLRHVLPEHRRLVHLPSGRCHYQGV